VALLATNPARIFGLYPRKGIISVGSDADIVLYDPRPQRQITSADLHMGLDYTIYEGWTCVGAPVMTILRGQVVVEDGKYVGTPGQGEFLKRQVSPEVLAGRLG